MTKPSTFAGKMAKCWEEIGINLLMPVSELDGIKLNAVESEPKNRAHDVLTLWNIKQHTHPKELIVALRKINRIDVIGYLLKRILYFAI